MRGLDVLMVFVAACTAQSAPKTSTIASTTTTPVSSNVEQQQAAWDALGIDAYRMVFTARVLNGMSGSERDGRFDVIVRNGRIISCVMTENAWNAGCSQAMSNTPVGQLFSYVTRGSSDYTTVTYDQGLAFPDVRWLRRPRHDR